MDMNKKIKVIMLVDEEPYGLYIMTAMQKRLLDKLSENDMLSESVTYCVVDDRETIDLTREEF